MKYHWANVFFQPFAGLLMTFALTSLGESHQGMTRGGVFVEIPSRRGQHLLREIHVSV
jgi:hypothetical protein